MCCDTNLHSNDTPLAHVLDIGIISVNCNKHCLLMFGETSKRGLSLFSKQLTNINLIQALLYLIICLPKALTWFNQRWYLAGSHSPLPEGQIYIILNIFLHINAFFIVIIHYKCNVIQIGGYLEKFMTYTNLCPLHQEKLRDALQERKIAICKK